VTETNGSLGREAFLRAKDIRIKAVVFPDSIPELAGQTMYVRSLKSGDRDRFEGSRVRLDDNRKAELVTDNTRARMVSMTACDAAGTLLFTEGDIDALGEKNAEAMDVLYDAALELNSMRTQDLEKKLKN
jgi:hypothetical protein